MRQHCSSSLISILAAALVSASCSGDKKSESAPMVEPAQPPAAPLMPTQPVPIQPVPGEARAISDAKAMVPCAGRRASKVEHMGLGSTGVIVECKEGKPTATELYEEPRGGSETKPRPLSTEAWTEFWTKLDAAGWRDLVPECPPKNPRPESAGMTDLDLEISDGTTSRKVHCGGFDLDARHEAIIALFDAALQAAVRP
jgi:hypothetical protein